MRTLHQPIHTTQKFNGIGHTPRLFFAITIDFLHRKTSALYALVLLVDE